VVENGKETPVNIGTGISTSMNEMLEIMMEESGWRPSKIVHLRDKKIGEKYRCANISMMSKIYKPRYSIRSVVKLYFERSGG